MHVWHGPLNNIDACWIPCRFGTISYAISFWTIYSLHGQPAELQKNFYAEVPATTYTWPMAAFGCALFLNISSWVFEHHPTRRQLCFLVLYISGIAFLYELSAWNEMAPIFLTASGRPISLLRYVMWMHATPAMLYALSLMSEFSINRTMVLVSVDIFMIVMAIPGELCASWILRYLSNALSFLAFPYVCHEIWLMFTQAMEGAMGHDNAGYKSLRALRVVTIILWSIFPVVWTLCQQDMIDNFTEEILLSLADVFGKIVFSSSVLQSNFLTIDNRRKLALKAVEDANRAAVIYELQELLAQKEEFIAVVTHELRTPLNGIIGLSDALLASSALDGANERSLSAIRNSGIRLLTLVNDVLDAAAMKRGTLVVQFHRILISNIVDDVLELTAPLVRPGVRLTSKIPAVTPPIRGDPQRLVQVLYNLVGNACKFTEEGEIRIEARGTADDDFVSVTVSDTGPGIPENKLEEVFIPFSQGNMSLRRRHGGTGLGLSVVKHIVEAHGGTITVKSKQGEGSAFTFTIPTHPDGSSIENSPRGRRNSDLWRRFSMDTEARKSFEFEKQLLKKAGRQLEPEKASSLFSSSQASLPDLSISNDTEGRLVSEALKELPPEQEPLGEALREPEKVIKVLSVDDDPVNQMVVYAMLKNKGFEVSSAADGERALDMIESQNRSETLPDIILLDVMMPGLNGFDVLRRIRSEYPHWNVPILLVSASSQKERVQEGIDAGANDYLTKPLKIDELSKTVKWHVQEAKKHMVDAR